MAARSAYAASLLPLHATATDLTILGRDVLDSFDVITSRRRNAVLLLADNHQYKVVDA